jgi:CDP-glucose 4,6-dehydratase
LVISQNFWSGKKVLLTGHTGFKGAWMGLLLNMLGAKVVGVSLPPVGSQNLYSELPKAIWSEEFNIDIRNQQKLEEVVTTTSPDIILHFAAQASVLESYRNPVSTWQTNVFGTQNLLEAIGKLKRPVSALFVTTDKVYKNSDEGCNFKEQDPLGGIDPYSSSKAAAELVIHSYARGMYANRPEIKICSARAGNVIGGGDWLENRIIPDIARAAKSKEELVVRNPDSIRPWQHVIDPLLGYLTLVEFLYNSTDDEYIRPFNFGPEPGVNRTVLDLITAMKNYFEFDYRIAEGGQFHEARTLSLDITQAKKLLSWHPLLDFDSTMSLTGSWYSSYIPGNGYKITTKQLEEILSRAH